MKFTAGQYTLNISDFGYDHNKPYHVTLRSSDGEVGSTNIEDSSLAILSQPKPDQHSFNDGIDDEAMRDELASIIRACLFSNYNGYPALWVGDGEAICYDCGCQELAWAMTYGDTFTYNYTVDWAHSDNPSGISCDNSGRGCTGWCYEPFCADCGTDESELSTSLVYNDSGDRCVCRDCIAKALHNERRLRSIPASDQTKVDEWTPRATLAGVNAYEITRAWYDDTYQVYR